MNVRPYQGILPRLGERVYIDPAAVVIGDVEMGADASAWPGAVIRGDVHWIRIGRRTSVQDGAVLHVTHDGPYNPGGFPLSIGDDVTIGHQAVLHGCTLGNRILVGIGAAVLDGAVIQDEVIIAAGTLVPPGKTLESGFLYKGQPACRARELTEQESRFFIYTAQRYVKLAGQYLQTDDPAD